MIVSHAFFTIPTALSLGVVVAILATSIVASLIATRRDTSPAPDAESEKQHA